jgi:hypothetical protein
MSAGVLPKATGMIASASKAVAPSLKAVVPLMTAAAPVLKVLDKAATPLAVGIAVVDLATAKTAGDRLSAGGDLVAGAAMYAGPVGQVFSASYTVTGLVDKGLERASVAAFGTDMSPSELLSKAMFEADQQLSKLWADPSRPAYTQTLGWKISEWLD